MQQQKKWMISAKLDFIFEIVFYYKKCFSE